jgi:hypothetical protein
MIRSRLYVGHWTASSTAPGPLRARPKRGKGRPASVLQRSRLADPEAGAHRAYDSEPDRQALREVGTTPHIPKRTGEHDSGPGKVRWASDTPSGVREEPRRHLSIDLRIAYAAHLGTNQKKPKSLRMTGFMNRAGEIRTLDLLTPSQAR